VASQDTTAPDRQRSGAPGPADAQPKREGIGERALAKIFLTPSFALMGIIALFPVGYAIYQSLWEFRFFNRGDFAGLGNYQQALTSGRFWEAVLITLAFTLVSVAIQFVIGMVFALIMNTEIKGRGVIRAVILVPWVVPTVIAAQMWRLMFSVNPGYINNWLGLGNFDWLGGGPSMFWAVVIADVWKTAPFVALLLLAGLQTIPGDLYEAGKVDGASWTQRFFQITLPLLKPAIVVALLFRSVDALRIFDQAYVMTRGRLETLSVLVQRFIVQDPNPGTANTLSTLTFILLMIVGIVFIRLMGRDVVESGR